MCVCVYCVLLPWTEFVIWPCLPMYNSIKKIFEVPDSYTCLFFFFFFWSSDLLEVKTTEQCLLLVTGSIPCFCFCFLLFFLANWLYDLEQSTLFIWIFASEMFCVKFFILWEFFLGHSNINTRSIWGWKAWVVILFPFL